MILLKEIPSITFYLFKELFCWLDELCLWKVECRISLHYKYFNKSSLLYNTLSKDSLSAQIRAGWDWADLGQSDEHWEEWELCRGEQWCEGSEKVSTRADQTNMDLAYEAIQTDIITDKYLRCLINTVYVSMVIFCSLLRIINENSVSLSYSG